MANSGSAPAAQSRSNFDLKCRLSTSRPSESGFGFRYRSQGRPEKAASLSRAVICHVSQPRPSSLRSARPAVSRDRALGLAASDVHVLVGCPSLDDLIRDLDRALEIAVAGGAPAAD